MASAADGVNHSNFLPCKLLVYGAAGTGRRTLITRLLGARCLSAWSVEDKDLVHVDGDNSLALGPIPLCGTYVQLICVKNPRIEQHTDAGAVAVLYDITSEQSLKYAHRFILEVQHALPSTPLLLVGNKLDLKSDSSLTEAAVQSQLSMLWPQLHSHFQLSAKQGHGITAFVASALAVPFLKVQRTKFSRRTMDWQVVAEQAMLWAFDNSMDSLVSYLKTLGMHLSATVIQLHGAAVERHLHRVKPWRAINVAAAAHGRPCKRVWKSLIMPKKLDSDEMSDVEREVMMAEMNGTILIHEQKSPVDSDAWQAIDMDSDGEDVRGTTAEMGCCVQWSRLMLETFVSSWLTDSCTALSSEIITHLNVSWNRLTFLPLEVYCLPSLVCLSASNNMLTEIPDACEWARLSKIKFLDLSANSIVNSVDSLGMLRGNGNGQRKESMLASTISPSSGPRKRPVDSFTQSLALRSRSSSRPGSPIASLSQHDDPRYSLAPSLWFIDLSRNKLLQMPQWILRLPSLSYLDLSYNKLQRLPSSLTCLTSLQHLRVTEVANIPQHIIRSGSATLLGHLGLAHNHLSSPSSPAGNGSDERRVQMVVFGPEGSGKSSLVKHLTGKEFDAADSAIQCVTYQQWSLHSPDRLRFFKPAVKVDLWDFSGKELVRPLHAALGARYALHLAVCSMVDVLQSCQRLSRYLVQLQTLHCGALLVIVVFTHYDQCGTSKTEREAVKRQCQQWVTRVMDDDSPSIDGIRWPSRCHPRIMGTVYVASPKGTGVSELQSLAYGVAVEMTGQQNPGSGNGYRISLPVHCCDAEKAIAAWKTTAEGYAAPMLMPAADLWTKLNAASLLRSNLNEFINALTLLGSLGLCTFFPPTPSSSHMTGVLVLDQHQMCSMVADVLRLTARIARTADDPSGVFTQSHLAMILTRYLPVDSEADDRLPWMYLSVIEAVGICKLLANGTVFMPSGLAVRFADVSAPLVWTEKSVARLFRVPCLSPIFWSLLLQRLAYQLEYIGRLYACQGDERIASSLSELHLKAIFWRSGCLLRTDGHQALVRACPTRRERGTNLLENVRLGDSSVPSEHELACLNDIDVLVEASDDRVHVKLLQVITQAIVDTVRQCSLIMPALVDSKGVLECLLACPACRGPASLHHSLSDDVHALPVYHFNLPACVLALDAQMEETKRRRLSSSAKTSELQGKLRCARTGVDVPLKVLIPDVLCEDLQAALAPAGAGAASVRGGGFRSLPRITNGRVSVADQQATKVFTRCFQFNLSSMAVDHLLQPYMEIRWRTETLLMIEEEGICPRPGSIVGHPPILRLPAPFKCSLAGYIEQKGRGFKRQQAHSIGHQLSNGLEYLLSKGVVHCNLNTDSVFLHNGRQLKICISDNGLRQQLSNNCLQEMFIQLGILLYEVVSGERLLYGVLSTSQLVRGFRNKRLRPSLEELVLDIIPLPKEHETRDRQGLRPQQQPRQRCDTTPYASPEGRRCNSEGTRRRHKHSLAERGRSNSDVATVTHTEIDRLLSSCAKLCMQAVMERCWGMATEEQINPAEEFLRLRRMLVLCCAATQWSPALVQHHVTAAAHHAGQKLLVWAAGSPRLQLGRLDLRTGVSQPQALSFIPECMPHLRNRHVAMRSEEHVTSVAVAEAANQLWIGVERNTSGALYVFSSVTQDILDSVDLDEDCDSAVLSVLAVPPSTPVPGTPADCQLVLAGVACGQVLVFVASAAQDGDDCSPLKQCICRLDSRTGQPCMVLAVGPGPASSIACAFGTSLAMLDTAELLKLAGAVKPDYPRNVAGQHLSTLHKLSSLLVDGAGKPLLERQYLRPGVVKMLTTAHGVWAVQRHSSLVLLLDSSLTSCKLILDCKAVTGIDDGVDAYILCLAATGPMLWLGTRGGHVALVNIPKAIAAWNGKEVVEDDSCLLGLRQPLPGCRIISIIAMADGALLSADAGGNAQAVCCIQRRLGHTDAVPACVGIFIVDIAVDLLCLND